MEKLQERVSKRTAVLAASVAWLAGTSFLIIFFSDTQRWYNAPIAFQIFGINYIDYISNWIWIFILFLTFLLLLACAVLTKAPEKKKWSSYEALICYGVIAACLVALIVQHHPMFIITTDKTGFQTVMSAYDTSHLISFTDVDEEIDHFLWAVTLLLLFWIMLLFWYLDAMKGVEVAFSSLSAAISFLFDDPPQTTKIAEPEQEPVKDEELLSLKQEVQNNPQSYEAWTELGYRQHELEQDTDALASANKALEILSTKEDLADEDKKKAYARAWLVRGAALSTMEKREDDAFAACEEALRYEENNLEALYYKGMILYFQNFDNSALSTFNKILHLNPTYQPALLSKGLLYLSINNFDGALAIAETLISLFPDNAAAWRIQGLAYQSQAEQKGLDQEKAYDLLNNALGSFDKAIELDPLDPKIYLLKADPYADIGDFGKALDTLNQGLKIDPNDKELQEAKAKIVEIRNNEVTRKIAGTAGRIALKGGVNLAKGSADIAKLFFNDVFRKP